MIDPVTVSNLYLLALCIWREARGASLEAMAGVGFSVRNRVLHPSWWGKDWHGVITAHAQYSSFNQSDANAVKFPSVNDQAFLDAFQIAQLVYNDAGASPGMLDPTGGCTHYFDRSLDYNPPSWSSSGTFEKVCDLGPFHFYRLKSYDGSKTV